jgi:hypothetical protein
LNDNDAQGCFLFASLSRALMIIALSMLIVACGGFP